MLSSSGDANEISATFDVFVKEVTATTLTGYMGNSDATTVFNQTITIPTNASNFELDIPFSFNYVYKGGNLLVGFYQTGYTSSSNRTYWAGENQSTNTAWWGYGNVSFEAQFLPKITFTYSDYVNFTYNANATSTANYTPFYGAYAADGTHGRFIIPKTSLVDLAGGTVKKLTFYSSTTTADWGAASFKVYVAEVEYSSFASNPSTSTPFDWSDMTQVYSGSLSLADGEMVIVLNEPFVYSGTKNLMIGFEETSTGTSAAVSWYCGSGVSSSCAYAYNDPNSSSIGYTTGRGNASPKMTFNYLPTPYQKIAAINEGTITTTTAELIWTAPVTTATITGYAYQYKKASVAEWPTAWSSLGATATSVTLSQLTFGTTYDFRIKVLYGENESMETSTSFATECDVHTLPYTYGFEEGYECWTMANCDSNTGIHPSAKHEGNYGFRFYYVANSQQCLISPEFECTTPMVVSFYYKNYSSNWVETFRVGYSTTTNTVDAFTWGDEVIANANAWMPYSEVFPANTKYVAIKHTSNDQNVFYLDDFSFLPVFTKTIAAYGSNDNPSGWYLIASPVAGDIAPSDGNGFITDDHGANATAVNATYDLYYFDQTGGDNGMEWKNYRANNFNIVNGTGYLYASRDGTTFTFTGTPYIGNRQVTLSKDDNARLGQWNLIGNPLSTNATIGSKPFYIMNEAGSEIITATRNYVEAMEGIFVEASSNGEIVTFETQTRGSESANEDLVLNLSQNDGTTIDRAIVRFGEGQTLPKFQIRENSTKLYIPQGGKDYAIATSEGQGEMPVNFRAEENGTYTLTVNPEGVEMAYLHLIDNMTGADVDLLQTPNYSFNAKTTDYESRFKLVFASATENADGDNDNFAFFNNGNIIVNNEGEATLQVMDVMGRIIRSESINGTASVNMNAAAGVYMLRLINGNDVKVQKMIVR